MGTIRQTTTYKFRKSKLKDSKGRKRCPLCGKFIGNGGKSKGKKK